MSTYKIQRSDGTILHIFESATWKDAMLYYQTWHMQNGMPTNTTMFETRDELLQVVQPLKSYLVYRGAAGDNMPDMSPWKVVVAESPNHVIGLLHQRNLIPDVPAKAKAYKHTKSSEYWNFQGEGLKSRHYEIREIDIIQPD
jgi:hypothetical protein